MARIATGLAVTAITAGFVAAQEPTPVDLSGRQIRSINENPDAQTPQARDWFRRVDVWGYVSATYLQTTHGGSRPRGSAAVDQASLFLSAEVDDNVSAFFEIQTDRFQTNQTFDVHVGEVYARVKHALRLDGEQWLGVKVGRFDIPFGESYLHDDSPDNPLIGTAVSHTYDVDEGILAYGKWHGIGFVGAFSDGNSDRQSSGEPSKAVTAKIYGDLLPWLYASGSVLNSGRTDSSAIYLGGIWLDQVGAFGNSTAGQSPSTGVGVTLAELDLRAGVPNRATLVMNAGYGRLRDVEPFDRTLYWFSLEPTVALCETLDATLRYSEIGTYSDTEGYQFSGRPFANADSPYGYDLSRLQQLEVGLAWRPQRGTIVKGEFGFDRLQAIDTCPFAGETRWFVALQFVVSF